MKNVIKVFSVVVVLLLIACMACTMTGCRQSSVVNYNLSKEADNFQIQRRVIVWNSRTDTVLFEMVGCFSLSNNDSNELQITCKTGTDTFQKHYIYLNEYTLYVVEDLGQNSVDPYRYELNINPAMADLVHIDFETYRE